MLRHARTAPSAVVRRAVSRRRSPASAGPAAATSGQSSDLGVADAARIDEVLHPMGPLAPGRHRAVTVLAREMAEDDNGIRRRRRLGGSRRTTKTYIVILGHLASQDGYGAMAAGGQRTHRVEYLIDPRGIGHSEPHLTVRRSSQPVRTRRVFACETQLGGPRHSLAVKACHDRLVGQGIDLGAYGLAANAEDLEDLRTTLGIGSWNLITNGSASRLAFEVARRYPKASAPCSSTHPASLSRISSCRPDALDLRSRLVMPAQVACARDYSDPDTMICDAKEARRDPFDVRVSGTVGAIQLGHPIQWSLKGARSCDGSARASARGPGPRPPRCLPRSGRLGRHVENDSAVPAACTMLGRCPREVPDEL